MTRCNDSRSCTRPSGGTGRRSTCSSPPTYRRTRSCRACTSSVSSATGWSSAATNAPTSGFLPGGTREPDESLDDCLARELQEEAGARLAGPFTPIGAHVGLSDQPTPYRPHLPHPRIGWLWGFADVVVDGEPTSPADGEQIAEVRIVDIAEARRLLITEEVWGAELLDVALTMRKAMPTTNQ
ncbi:MAG: NUDIX hydrolase [Actinomycetota bacterium]|nr:NUDIX hydrolase [Actinomycetota bacterium]